MKWLSEHPDAARVLEQRRADLISQGFAVQAPIVIKQTSNDFGQSAQNGLWQRLAGLSGVHADSVDNYDGYLVVTGLDDGNPNTGEFDLYVALWDGSTQMWGTLQFDANDPSDVWLWGTGGNWTETALNNENRSNPLDALAPEVHAAMGCDGGYIGGSAVRDIFRDAWLGAGGAFLGAIVSCSPSIFAGPGGYLSCVGISSFYGFLGGLTAGAIWAAGECVWEKYYYEGN